MASYRYLTLAIDCALSGLFDAIATAPLTKATLHMAGVDEPGHTEILARRTRTDNYAMMLYSPRIAVALVTIHQSVASVAATLTPQSIARVIELAGHALRKIRGKEPKIGVLALNPHAGEGGLFGDEESRVIGPAIELAARRGLAGRRAARSRRGVHAARARPLRRPRGDVSRPGSDPLQDPVVPRRRERDTGPAFVRTSPDHGTAYDIAGAASRTHRA